MVSWRSASTASASSRPDSLPTGTGRARLHGLGGGRQLHHEPGAAELPGILEPDLSPHLGHDALADGEAQACPFIGALGGEEGVEDAASNLKWHARPGVLHRQPYPALPGLGGQLND